MISSVQITPLGGVGREVGALNCMVYQTEDAAVIVDSGSMFPDADTLGVDLIIPDFSYLHEIKHKLVGIVLTHGHEDHIGSVPFLLQELDLPVYGTPFTIELIKKKLNENPPPKRAKLTVFKPGDTLQVGPFTIETAFVNHSIIDACALAFKTEQGVVVHLTDWKIDKTPLDDVVIDLKKFEKWGKEGVVAFLSDSTNAGVGGKTMSEKDVAKQIKKICTKHKGRVVVALFSSHIHRVGSLVEIAESTGRVLAVCGRSMKDNTTIARELGSLSFEGVNFIDVEQAGDYPPEKVMVLVTGTQGEPRSVLSRIAFNEFKPFKIGEGDLVLFSSRIIPGNEKNIYNVINNLARHGARVIYESIHEIHTSGHAHQDEIKTIYKALKPKYVVPIHGTYMHLQRHAEIAMEWGHKKQDVLIIENGQAIKLMREAVQEGKRVQTGRVFVDGSGVGDVSDTVLRDRKTLSTTGMVTCVVMIDRTTGEIMRGPDLITKGVINEKENPEIIEGAKRAVTDSLEAVNQEARTDMAVIQEEVRLAIRRYFRRELDRKPVVIPVVLEV